MHIYADIGEKMAEIKFTESQSSAIEFDKGNLLISAAAGSGKTAVLTEKIAKLIAEKKCTVDELLVVTFTKAAASEMKKRIRSKLSEKKNDKKYKNSAYSRYIDRQMSRLSSADICTMDSFLYKRVRRYFTLLGKSPDTRIASDGEIEELEHNVMSGVIAKRFAENDNEKYAKWLRFCDIISKTKDTSQIDEELLELAHGMEDSFSGDCERKITDEDEIYEQLKKYTTELFEHYKNTFAKIVDDLELEDDNFKKLEKNVAEVTTICNEMLELCESDFSFDKAAEYLRSVRFARLGTVKSENATPATRAFRAVREEFKAEINDLIEKIYVGDAENIHIENSETAEIEEQLLSVLSEYFTTLDSEKSKKSLMSYSDLENYSRQIMEIDSVADEISQRYKYIFIDEFQDTNETQDYIFKRISKNASRFLVGDIKQSIYRFRGADPSVFNGYRNEWEKYNYNEEVGNYTLFMSENFRCSKEIIGFTNLVTGKLFENSDITYTDEDALVFGKSDEAEKLPVEVVLLDKRGGVRGMNIEAEYVAERIYAQIGEYSSALKRNIKAEDIAIIMRSPSSHGEEFGDALRRRGVKSKLKKSQPLEESQAVRLIVCLLEVIKNPLDDIYLAGALISPFFGFTVEDITKIKEITGEEQLFIALNSVKENDENPTFPKEPICKFLEWLEREKRISAVTPPGIYAENFISENRAEIMSATDGDESETEALNELVELIGGLENGATLDTLIEQLKLEIAKKSNARADDEAKDSVSIVSIHSSKGLEYPICYLCETDRKRSKIDEQKPFLYDKELGYGVKISDESGLAVKNTLKRDMIAKKLAKESNFEEIRMLYVAMTRAKNQLIICGKVSDSEKALQKGAAFSYNIDEYTVANTESYLEWILITAANQNSQNHVIREVGEFDYSDSGDKTCEEERNTDDDLEEILTAIAENSKNNKKITNLNIPIKANAGALSSSYLDGETENQQEEEKEALEKPRFMTGANSYTGAEKGVAMHTFMQFMNIENLERHGIDAEIERLIETRMISYKLSTLLDKKQIFIFMHSELYRRIQKASYVKREFRFNINLPAENFTENEEMKEEIRNNNGEITVQGVIDCIYRNADTGKLELIDYKTDRFTAEQFKNRRLAYEKLRQTHKNQLAIYKTICEKIYEEKIARVYIYSTVLGELVEVKTD